MAGKVDFMVIGAMKCGTTSLTTELSRHPQVGFSDPKEPDFFIREDWRMHVPEYEGLFPSGDNLFRGEGSTSYTKRPVISPEGLAEDLYEYNPALKFIYIMRHPIERLISHYRYNVSHGAGLPALEQAVKNNPHMLNVGRYFYQLEPFLTRFGRDRILLLILEEYQQDRQRVLDEVGQFLGIDPRQFGPEAVHQGNAAIVPNSRLEHLIASPIVQRAKRLVPRSFKYRLRTWATHRFSKKATKIPVHLTPEFRTFLKDHYRKDVDQITRLMGRSEMPWEGWGGEELKSGKV